MPMVHDADRRAPPAEVPAYKRDETGGKRKTGNLLRYHYGVGSAGGALGCETSYLAYLIDTGMGDGIWGHIVSLGGGGGDWGVRVPLSHARIVRICFYLQEGCNVLKVCFYSPIESIFSKGSICSTSPLFHFHYSLRILST